MRRITGLAILTSLFFSCASGPAFFGPEDPGQAFFWEGQTPAGGRIAVLGLVPVAAQKTPYLPPALEKTLDHVDGVFTEVQAETETPELRLRLLAQYGLFPRGTTLKDQVPADRWPQWQAFFQKMNLDPEVVQIYKPWALLLFRTSEALADEAKDFSPEVYISRRLAYRGTPVVGLVSLEDQFRSWSTWPMEDQVAFLQREVERGSIIPHHGAVEDLQAVWLRGKPLDPLRIVIQTMKKEAPGLYRILHSGRSQLLADLLMQNLQRQDFRLILLDADLLVGPDSFPEILEKKGVVWIRKPPEIP